MERKQEGSIAFRIIDEYVIFTTREATLLRGRAIRDGEGKLFFEITVPGAAEIVLPDDLPDLVLSFGWAITFLGTHASLCETPTTTYRSCCEVMEKVEAL